MFNMEWWWWLGLTWWIASSFRIFQLERQVSKLKRENQKKASQ